MLQHMYCSLLIVAILILLIFHKFIAIVFVRAVLSGEMGKVLDATDDLNHIYLKLNLSIHPVQFYGIYSRGE